MCTASIMDQFGGSSPGKQISKPGVKVTAADLPLGEGLADSAKTSILSRRERIRAALDEAGG